MRVRLAWAGMELLLSTITPCPYAQANLPRLEALMRASEQAQTGETGSDEISANFRRLGWGVVLNSRDDLGTDMFLMVRDARLFDLGLVVGAQAKAGRSYFEEPRLDDEGKVDGWWYREGNRDHFDAWLEHALPHLIVLHDLDTRTSYWAHVVPGEVVSTGSGAKILVRKSDTVDEEHRDALVEAASTVRPGSAWEGSAWTGVPSLAPKDQLRYSLIVPRVVAPHPRAGFDSAISATQALALVVQCRVRDLGLFAERHAAVPSVEEARASADWAWRFVGGFGHRILTGDLEELVQVAHDAPDAPSRAAATAAAAAALVEVGRVDDALELLETALAEDGSGPVDHAWLVVQHARVCTEVGRIDDARAAVMEVLGIRSTHPNDLTATAIAGVGAQLLFYTAGWARGVVGEAITGGDTIAAWWRDEVTSAGLSALVEREFGAWSRDTTVTIGATDIANNELLATSLAASHVGDHREWRYLQALLGKDILLRQQRDSEPGDVAQGLTTLRLAGDDAALKLAMRRIVTNGPARAITHAAADLDLDASTRTSGLSDLTLLEQGGDLVDQETADRWVAWLLATIVDSSRFQTRTSAYYILGQQLVNTLAGLVYSSSAAVGATVVESILTMPPQVDQLLATCWASVVRALSTDAWTKSIAERISAVADVHNEMLRLPMLAIAARFDAGLRTRLAEEAATGSLRALSAFGDVRDLSPEVVRALIQALAGRVERTIQDARGGSFAFGATESSTLAMLNVWHPAEADWETLFQLLRDPHVAGRDKHGAFSTLASLEEFLPEHVRPTLQSVSTDASDSSAVPVDFFFPDEGDAQGAATALAIALDALDASEAADRLVALLAGRTEQRSWVARVARRRGTPADVGLLVGLAQDPEPEVRAAAASGLALLVARADGGELAVHGLRHCCIDEGTLVPLYVVRALEQVEDLSTDARRAVESLTDHPSARVRGRSSAILGRK